MKTMNVLKIYQDIMRQQGDMISPPDHKSPQRHINNSAHRFCYSKEESSVCREVVLSKRAYLSILAEALSRDPLETGGILLGRWDGAGTWYVVEATDAGIHTVNTEMHTEMDEIYHNHVYVALSRLYKIDLWLLGLWHRHPGDINRFSSDDDMTNARFCKAIGKGTLSFLLNFTPEPELTCYYLDDAAGQYHRPKLEIGDLWFEDTEYLKLADKETLFSRKLEMQAEINRLLNV